MQVVEFELWQEVNLIYCSERLRVLIQTYHRCLNAFGFLELIEITKQ